MREEYVDLSHRSLAVTAWDQGLFQASFSTVYRTLKTCNLSTLRGPARSHNGKSVAPRRQVLTGPNQRWCWDISYLVTFEKGRHLYLYLLLDEFSRKALQWLVSWHLNKYEAERLINGALISENILDLPEAERPQVINDNGSQMRAKSMMRLFEDHKMSQKFCRPRTPNDNPFIESAFSTVKRAPRYPGRFLDEESGKKYFDEYFPWYNNEHYHSGISYVTPNDAHRGLMNEIVARRRALFKQQQLYRREVNQKLLTGQNNQVSLIQKSVGFVV